MLITTFVAGVTVIHTASGIHGVASEMKPSVPAEMVSEPSSTSANVPARAPRL